MVNDADRGGDLLGQVARALEVRAGAGLDAPVGERGSLILGVARDIAHAGERQQAPLSAYLIGRYVELRRQADGTTELDALAEAAAEIARLTGTDAAAPG